MPEGNDQVGLDGREDVAGMDSDRTSEVDNAIGLHYACRGRR
jgi:hypothetical protein